MSAAGPKLAFNGGWPDTDRGRVQALQTKTPNELLWLVQSKTVSSQTLPGSPWGFAKMEFKHAVICDAFFITFKLLRSRSKLLASQHPFHSSRECFLVDPVPKCRRDVPTVSALQKGSVAQGEPLDRLPETRLPHAEAFASSSPRPATGAASKRRRGRPLCSAHPPFAQRQVITQHSRCMYSFCRRLPPCPAGTQCQCGSAVNVAASVS
jgi:hypothetical protein